MFNATQLLTQLKKKIKLPDGSFDDQDLLDFCHLALTSELIPELIKAREAFYVTSSTLTVTAGGSVRIPSRAFGGIIREIKLTKDERNKNLLRLDEEDFSDPTTTGEPNSFCVRGNRIVLSPSPDQAYDIFLTYWLAPPRIVPVSECAIITAISTNTITCTPPSTWTTSNTFDIVKGTSDYEPCVIDATATSLNTTQIVLTNTPSDIEIGDYICLAGESPYAYLQSSYYPVLLQYAVSLIHEANGDLEQKGASDAKAEAMLGRLQGVYSDRVQGAPKKIISSLL